MHKFTLSILAAFFLIFGLWMLIAPQGLSLAKIELNHPTALMEVRAFFGGLEIALAVFFLTALKKKNYIEPALFLAALLLGGVIFGRLVGALVDGVEGAYLYLALAMEIPLFVLVLLSLKKLSI